MEFPNPHTTNVTGINVQIYGAEVEFSVDFLFPSPSGPLTHEVIAEKFLEFGSALAAEAEASKPTGTTINASAQWIGSANAEADLP